jgi:hypothetical protein
MYDLKDQMKSFNREGLTDMSTNDANTSEQDSDDGENDPSLLALPHEKTWESCSSKVSYQTFLPSGELERILSRPAILVAMCFVEPTERDDALITPALTSARKRLRSPSTWHSLESGYVTSCVSSITKESATMIYP